MCSFVRAYDSVDYMTKLILLIQNNITDLQHAKKGTFGHLRKVSLQISLRSPRGII